MPFRSSLVAAALTALVIPAALASSAHAAPAGDDLPSVVKVAMQEIDDYFAGEKVPVEVTVDPPADPTVEHAGLLYLLAIENGLPGDTYQKTIKVPKRTTKTVKLKLPKKAGTVKVKACVGKPSLGRCKTTKPFKVRKRPASPRPPKPAGLKPGTYPIDILGVSLDTTVDARKDAGTFCADHGFPSHGIKHTTATASGGAADNVLVVERDGSVHGRAVLDAASTYAFNTLSGCETVADGSTISCATSRTDTGHENIGMYFESNPENRRQLKVHWFLPDPDGGFVDADNSVCNVPSIWHGIDLSVQEGVYPLDGLLEGKVWDFGLEDDVAYTEDQTGEAASISYGFKEDLRMQVRR